MPNQINEDELQKAIDDITNSAQNGVDAGVMPAEVPAPVAAGVVPEAGMPAPEAAPMPDFGVPPMPPVPPTPGAFNPNTAAPAPVEAAPMVAPPEGTPEAVAAPVAGEVPAPEMPVEMPAPVENAPVPEVDAGTDQIKAEILRDLSPLMDKVEMEPEKKFHIYRDMMTTNNDKSVIPSAYETAKLIGDEQKRGEALVSLIDAIDS